MDGIETHNTAVPIQMARNSNTVVSAGLRNAWMSLINNAAVRAIQTARHNSHY